jgi:hypothetical protein
MHAASHDFSGTFDGLAFLDQTIGAEQHNTDLASLEVHAHALDARGEPANGSIGIRVTGDRKDVGFILDKLLGLDVGHAVHTRDTITAGRPKNQHALSGYP